jgi:hypothetical protein
MKDKNLNFQKNKLNNLCDKKYKLLKDYKILGCKLKCTKRDKIKL